MIEITGLDQIDRFLRELDQAFYVEFDQSLSRAFEDWTKMVFRKLVETTPQFTGDLASAWNYSIKAPDYTYHPIPSKAANDRAHGRQDLSSKVYSRGDEPAVRTALAKADGVHPTWRDVVYFTNPAPIAEEVENKMILIRPVNLVDGRVAMIQYYVDKFHRGELQP